MIKKITIKVSRSSVNSWYHGSPHGDLVLDEKTLYLTNSYKIALSYAMGTVAKANLYVGKPEPTIYEISVHSGTVVFDFRNKSHQNLYVAARVLHNSFIADPDENLPKIDSPGFLMRHSGLPGYGSIPTLKQILGREFDGIYVDEGSQGTSLAVFNGKHSLSIVRKKRL